MLQRQQLYLGVPSQKICADDNVKGGGVELFAVLSPLPIAQTNGNIEPPPVNGWSDQLQPLLSPFWVSGSWLVAAVCGPRLKA